jgi:hypothetical protein
LKKNKNCIIVMQSASAVRLLFLGEHPAPRFAHAFGNPDIIDQPLHTTPIQFADNVMRARPECTMDIVIA